MAESIAQHYKDYVLCYLESTCGNPLELVYCRTHGNHVAVMPGPDRASAVSNFKGQ